MQALNSWLHDVFITPSVLETLVWLTLVSAVGILLGKLRVGKISLGITFVFFVGILSAHFGVRVDPEMNSFAQTLGLALFVYALGVEVGPSFFPSLKSQGVLYNTLGLMVIGLGLTVVVALHYICGISMPNMLGIMAGAVTIRRCSQPYKARCRTLSAQLAPAKSLTLRSAVPSPTLSVSSG